MKKFVVNHQPEPEDPTSGAICQRIIGDTEGLDRGNPQASQSAPPKG